MRLKGRVVVVICIILISWSIRQHVGVQSTAMDYVTLRITDSDGSTISSSYTMSEQDETLLLFFTNNYADPVLCDATISSSSFIEVTPSEFNDMNLLQTGVEVQYSILLTAVGNGVGWISILWEDEHGFSGLETISIDTTNVQLEETNGPLPIPGFPWPATLIGVVAAMLVVKRRRRRG